MIMPELGQFALILALCLALAQAALPLVGAARGNRDWMALARPAAVGQFVFVVISFGILANAFLHDDFSVRYVAEHSNTQLPIFYKLAAVWGGHEGSMLLWITVLGVWTLAVAWSNRDQPEEFASRVLGVLGIVSAGVMAFTLLTSNPFDRLIPAATEGNDLNPLLQDPAMVGHPPMLYSGYVGMAVPFAFAVAALLTGRLTIEWAKWTRPWVITSWIFLTVGIALGSWWAYYELGWGGWWFWDPVENASFMPWLMATALMHSLAVTERRGLFKSWTVLLAIAAFSLSLLGTFLTRSGVLISVHAFASDPRRGLFILMLLTLISGGALLLYAFRAKSLGALGGFKLLSREAFLLANNILLVVAAAAILFGTLYPLFVSALGLKPVSVGPPYFNPMFLVPMLPLAALLGVGMHAFWKSTNGHGLLEKVRWPAAIAAILGIGVPWVVFGRTSVLTAVAAVIGVWVCACALLDPVRRLLNRRAAPLTRAQWGMTVAHLGVGLFIVGATVTSAYNVELDRAARPGDHWQVGGYDFEFRGTHDVTGPNFDATEGEIAVRRGGDLVAVLHPQKRTYRVQTSPMTEAGIDGGLGRDVFVALGEPLGDGAWSVRAQVKPMVRFLWLGAFVMALGGILAASDRRYRREALRQREAAALAAAAGANVEGS
ncbi:MAG TPA: heme lyase CcmF/NrfE family subunit [Gammaproteobacteria bacterium]|nr:heme lyase CcmF/NrfE family subunit [Gammaproteobacteria bacterium]